MENISSVGVDVSKNVFHLVGVNHSGRIVLHRGPQPPKTPNLLSCMDPPLPTLLTSWWILKGCSVGPGKALLGSSTKI